MPLIQSPTKKAFSSNMSELMKSFKKKGRIGNSKPLSPLEARKKALAIAFDVKGQNK